MKAERVILSFVAVVVGLVAAGVAFYFYQMTKTLPSEKSKPVVLSSRITPSPTPDKSHVLEIESPQDESVSDKKVITINGKTDSNATVIISSEDADQVVKPSETGDFSLTVTLPVGTTVMQITAIFPNGEEKKVTRTVTFSTENF